MALVSDHDLRFTGLSTQTTSGRRVESIPAVPALALLSLAAGLLHATVVTSHDGHGVAAAVFVGIAIFQLNWAVLAVAVPNRIVLALGAVVNSAIIIGYIFSRTTGISFIDGFQEAESVGFTDAVTTAFEVLLVAGAVQLLFAGAPRRVWSASSRARATGFGAIGLVVALVGIPAALAAPTSHDHGQHDVAAGGDDHHGGAPAGDHHGGATSAAGHHDPKSVAAAPSSAVTPEQQAAADKLLADTKALLPQWADSAVAEAAGFRTIGDGITGNEHLINWNWINDDVVLDPNRPESLVYRPTPNGRVLEAAMYMVRPGTADADLPDVGGTLTQWHIHNNLCLSPERTTSGAPQRFVVGVTSNNGPCSVGERLPNAQMLHVWIVPNECGPFSALEGIGGGQAVTEAQDPNADPKCQHSH
jgi:hypothetical protein